MPEFKRLYNDCTNKIIRSGVLPKHFDIVLQQLYAIKTTHLNVFSEYFTEFCFLYGVVALQPTFY